MDAESSILPGALRSLKQAIEQNLPVMLRVKSSRLEILQCFSLTTMKLSKA